MTVIDENWAAHTLSNVIVREGRDQTGLDLALVKGTLIHGQVSEPPGPRPAAGAEMILAEEGPGCRRNFGRADSPLRV